MILLCGHEADAVVGVTQYVFHHGLQVAVWRGSQEEADILPVLKLVAKGSAKARDFQKNVVDHGLRLRHTCGERRRISSPQLVCSQRLQALQYYARNQLPVSLSALPFEYGEENKGILRIFWINLSGGVPE
jgi:hypothetical protein